jgi:hypothetical protein
VLLGRRHDLGLLGRRRRAERQRHVAPQRVVHHVELAVGRDRLRAAVRGLQVAGEARQRHHRGDADSDQDRAGDEEEGQQLGLEGAHGILRRPG